VVAEVGGRGAEVVSAMDFLAISLGVKFGWTIAKDPQGARQN